LDCGRW